MSTINRFRCSRHQCPPRRGFLQLCFCSYSGTVILLTQSRRIPFLHAVVTEASATPTIFRSNQSTASRARNEELQARTRMWLLLCPTQRDASSSPCPSLLPGTWTQTETCLLEPFFTSPHLASRCPGRSQRFVPVLFAVPGRQCCVDYTPVMSAGFFLQPMASSIL